MCDDDGGYPTDDEDVGRLMACAIACGAALLLLAFLLGAILF